LASCRRVCLAGRIHEAAMIAMMMNKRRELSHLCERYRVRRLELFGSALTGAFDPATSDLDLLVEFGDVPAGCHADCYFGLLEALETLFGRSVDLVEARAIENPYFLAVINQGREVLYAA
jgi:uncharacterized protein